MYKCTLLVLLLTIFAVCSNVQAAAQNWAVLVAGSNGYYNYRHQSDICHAYQIFKKNGVPDSNIIVMMYDDIANNAQNPKKGSIINTPGGPNVYPGVPKDYTGNLVTPENFLSILSGKDMKGIGSGKTLKSGPEDRVFVYFSDHGAPGLVAFPGYKMLYAKDLIQVLKSISAANRFKEMVFYIEACESGSMFNKILSNDLRIYATTASNPFESSYACNYDNTYNAYLNDCYSINFLNNTEFSPLDSYTLQQQFEAVKKQTTQSHVCQYGDVSIAKQPIGNYFSNSFKDVARPSNGGDDNGVPKRGVNSRDVKEVYLLKMLEKSSQKERAFWQKEYDEYKKDQAKHDVVFGALSHSFNLHRIRDARANRDSLGDDRCSSDEALDLDCMKAVTQAYENACGNFDEYSIRYAGYLRDACVAKVSINSFKDQVNKICTTVKH